MTHQSAGMPFDALSDAIGSAMGLLQGATSDVYLRTITETGGDALLGIRGTEGITDALVSPRPFVGNVSFKEIQVSGGKLRDGDMAVLFGPGTTKAQVQASLVVIGGLPYEPIMVSEWPVAGTVPWMRVVVRARFEVGQGR